MDFKTLFRILKDHLADGADSIVFFLDLMALMTTVPEDELGTKKDPAGKARLSKETIRSYTKARGLSKKFAQNIVYRLTPERLAKRIKKMKKTPKLLLVRDISPYEPSVTENNVGEAVAGILVGIIQTSAGLAQPDKLQRERHMLQAAELKNKYGEYLLEETESYCHFPGCGRQLTVSQNGKIESAYEVCLIDKNKPATVDNLIALCPKCHATYLLDNSKQAVKPLSEVKKILATHRKNLQLLDEASLERGLIGVISCIKKLKETDLGDPAYDPKQLREKINPSVYVSLFIAVNNYVTMYFRRLKEIMVSLDKRGEIDFEEIQNQMKAIYRRLNKANKSKMDIYREITEKVHRVTLQDDIYCQIVVSYFIQSCEVFDATAE
ncbi:MAG: hypothetical protein IJ812_09760 [Schwartzia sp.]|nr:hypothetical protein [Schwartzia sp. (in: firmicutes)]